MDAQRQNNKHSQDKFDPRFLKRLRPLLSIFYDYYFRVGVHGIGNIPDKKPALIVGNHNGVFGTEVMMILEAWYRHKPPRAARVLALAHDHVFQQAAFRSWVPKLGAIPANRDSAMEALQKGYSVLVYPGGDRDIFRPYSHRAKVDFDGRTGYAQLALDAGVPIIPLVNVGGHETAIVLHRADNLAKKRDFKRKYRVSALPITLRGLPFLPGVFFTRTERAAVHAMIGVSAFPLPAKIDFYFEKPISLSRQQIAGLSKDEQVSLLNRRTLESLEGRLSGEYAKPRIPILGPVERFF